MARRIRNFPWIARGGVDTAKLEFLRGTLDVLILKALNWARFMVMPSVISSDGRATTLCWSKRARSIPPSGDWKTRGCLSRSRDSPKTIAKPSFTGSPQMAGANWVSGSKDLESVRHGGGEGARCDPDSSCGGDKMKPTPLWRRYARFFGLDPGADVKDELRFHLEAKVDYTAALALRGRHLAWPCS